VGVRSARRPHLAAIPPNILKIVITRDGHPFTVRYALQNYPPRALHGACARDGAGNSRSRCAFASRILGSTDIGSTAIKCHLVSKTRKTTVQIHHIALSANVLFRLTLPRTRLTKPRPSTEAGRVVARSGVRVLGRDEVYAVRRL